MLATIAVGVATALSGVADAVAQNSGPVIVIPTRRDVPVVLYGRDVSYVVVESDWGLSRPGHLPPSIVGYAPPIGNRASPLRGVNYPRYGVAPKRGRNEVEPPPNRQLPEPAESFSRSWGAQSPGVVAPPPAYQRPLDPIYPTDPNGAPLGPHSQNAVPPMVLNSQSNVVTPATVIDPQTFMMPPVVVDQRRQRSRPRP
jgi:hypothetical protein